MDSHSHTKWKLKSLIHETDAQLQEISCCPFSNKAKAMLRRKIRKYIRELVSNSIAVAQHQEADGVSESHVVQASNNLTNNTNKRFFRHLGTIGGILCGASISNLVAVISGAQYSTATILIVISLGFIGTFMVALHIAKDS